MRRRFPALALTILLFLLSSTAFAAEPVTPTPPAWCPEEEYARFPGSAAYEPENWDTLQRARKEVQWGAINLAALPNRQDFENMEIRGPEGGSRYDMGVLFEKALVEVRLLYTDNNAVTGPRRATLLTYVKDGESALLDGLTDQQRYAVLLWAARGTLYHYGAGERLNAYLPALTAFPQFSLEKLTDCAIFSPEEQARLAAQVAEGWTAHQNRVELYLDGEPLALDVPPEVKNQRTMVPIRAVAEAIGADVAWDQAARTVTMTRAGSTVTMTLDSTAATVDGKTVEMDVAPYATQGRTLIPARYAAEFFGQSVTWDGETRRAAITEDKSAAEPSNLEAWALAMGAIRGAIDHEDSARFGQRPRSAEAVQDFRQYLSSDWGIQDRAGLIDTVSRMTFFGHNVSYLEILADTRSLSEEEKAGISAASSAWPSYMWDRTAALDARWGDKGILAWDLSRMSTLVQWGYAAGYVTYEEALALMEPAARRTAETFSNWHEFYLNYLDGYNWWARNDVDAYAAGYEQTLKKHNGGALPDGWQDWWGLPRSAYYRAIQGTETLDDALFDAGVIGLPGRSEP